MFLLSLGCTSLIRVYLLDLTEGTHRRYEFDSIAVVARNRGFVLICLVPSATNDYPRMSSAKQ